MKDKLAIFSPYLGTPSETFIRRHVQDLAPGSTVALWNKELVDTESHWSSDCPSYKILEKKKLCHLLPKFISKRCPEVWRHPDDLNGLKQFLKHHDVKVFLGEFLNESWPYLEFVKSLGIRFFAHAHGFDLSMMFKHEAWRKRYADYAKADGVVVVNQVMRERLVSVGVPEDKVFIIPYGINVPDEPLCRQENEKVRCFAVGRMVGKKAPLKLLEAFRLAVVKNPLLCLDFVGAGPMYSMVEKYVEAFDLGEQVTLHGGQSNSYVMNLMKNADIFLQHSIVDPITGDEEGVPVAIIEAMASALPVVSTFHAGIPEAVLHEDTGFLVREGDAEGMAEYITLLSNDSSLRKSMGKLAWSRSREMFSWEQEKRELLKILF